MEIPLGPVFRCLLAAWHLHLLGHLYLHISHLEAGTAGAVVRTVPGALFLRTCCAEPQVHLLI